MSKYFAAARKTKGIDGQLYDSKFEASYADELYLRKKGKDIRDYETQVSFQLEVNGYSVGTYKADFVVTHNDGSLEIVETKGHFTPEAKLKFRIVQALYSDRYKITLCAQGKIHFRPAKKLIKKPISSV